MDNLFIWMLTSAGAVIGLLATFLIASERELKIKRRQLEIFADKLAGSIETGSTNNGAGAAQQAGEIQQLETKNAQLRGEVEALSRKLQASEDRAEELNVKVREFSNRLSENERLRTANQELFDEIRGLKNQLATNRTEGDLVYSQQQALEGQHSALEVELSRVKADLEESRVKLEALQKLEVELDSAKTREQEAQDRCAEGENQIADLTDQLARNREKVTEFDSLLTRLRDVERRYEEASAEGTHFREEISNWQGRFATACTSMRRLEILRKHFHGLHAKQLDLSEKQDDLQRGMSALKDLLDDAPPSSFDAAGLSTEDVVAYAPKSLFLPAPGGESSLDAVKRNIESGYFEEALQQLDQLLKDGHENRMIKLYHLLASVQLHHGNGFERQIDAIAEMADLSDSERLIARDIFLARAEEAQKCGRDNEMLRYRAWAKNVIYRTPFGSPELGSSGDVDGLRSKDGRPSSGQAGGPAEMAVSVPNDSPNGTDNGDLEHGEKRVVILATAIALLVIAGIMFAGSFEDRKPTTIPPSMPAVQKSATSATDQPSKDQSPPSSDSSAVKDESSAVRITPNNKASQSQPFGHSRA